MGERGNDALNLAIDWILSKTPRGLRWLGLTGWCIKLAISKAEIGPLMGFHAVSNLADFTRLR